MLHTLDKIRMAPILVKVTVLVQDVLWYVKYCEHGLIRQNNQNGPDFTWLHHHPSGICGSGYLPTEFHWRHARKVPTWNHNSCKRIDICLQLLCWRIRSDSLAATYIFIYNIIYIYMWFIHVHSSLNIGALSEPALVPSIFE